MNNRAVKFSKLLGVVAGLALAAASVAQAQGQRDRVVEREAQRDQQQAADSQQQQQAQQQQAQQQQAQQQQQRRGPPAQSQQTQSPGQRGRVVEREAQREQQRNYGRPGYGYGGNGRPVYGGSPGYRTGGPHYRNPNYGRVVTRLPPGYRDYRWGGNPYYYAGGSWYSRRGSSYVIVGAPFGLYVDYLPSYYSTVWVGGSRYYYADDTYYTYDTGRRGYVVTRSPYNDEDSNDDDSSGPSSSTAPDELYIYPTKGQSDRQQADDKYECHKWSFDQTGYDPTQMEYESGKREQYDRALTACLTARGYSVK